MSKFRVGQRVRIVGSEFFGTGPHPAGLEAVVTDGPGSFIGRHTGRTYTWKITAADGRKLNANSHDLEPATDCYDKTEWDACVWKPGHLRVAV